MFMTFDKQLYFSTWLIFIAGLSRSFVTATLPSPLQSVIPACAQPCLETLILVEYSGICSQPATLDCLCTHYGHSGYAIVEGATTCVQSSNCTSAAQTNSSSIPFICVSVPNAVTGTQIPTSTPPPSTVSKSSSTVATAAASTTTSPPSATTMTEASVSAGPGGVSVSGKLSLSMAQIAGITIAAAALLILAVGVLSCIFFVRKRNKRLEAEDQKQWTQSATPKSQDMYFPPPPLSAGRRSRGSSRFSIMPRRKSKDSSEEGAAFQLPGTSLQQRTWPRYYPIMPEENIGIATTTSYPYPVDPIIPTTYTPAPALAPSPPHTPVQVQVAANPTISRASSVSTVPAYQPYSEYHSGITMPQPPAIAHMNNGRFSSQSSKRSSKLASKPRQSKTFSFMTDIDESAQISSHETSLAEMSGSSSCESIATSSGVTAAPSAKKTRRPTLTINIPGHAQSKPALPPPPSKKPPSRVPSVLPGPPSHPPPARAPSTNMPPPPQRTASRARSTSIIIPTQQKLPKISTTVPKPQTRPPLLREEHVHQIPNSPSDILAAASTYASARKTNDSPSRDSASSAALPSSQLLGGASFLISDSERNSSSRSNSSVRRPSRAPSRTSRRGSDASCTSFEDDGEESEDETPPKEDNKRLSPVTESSPVSTLRYPKVPRGANQVVPRSPGTPKKQQTDSSQPSLTPTRLRPEVNTAAAAAISQTIGNKLWKTELSPQGKKPLPTPEWAAHRRSESWQTWAQNTPEASSAGTLQTPQKPFANGEGPRITPTKRGDDLFLEMRF